MQSPLTFDRPWLLLLLPPLLYFFWRVARLSYAGMHPATQWSALGMRSLIGLCLVAAMAGPRLVIHSDRLTTVFVLDLSQSIRPAQRAQSLQYLRKAWESKRRDDMAGVIVFGRTAFLQTLPTDASAPPDNISPSVGGTATNIQDALRLAQSALGTGSGKKIVLLTDGNQNLGTAENEIDSLKASGVRVDIASTDLGQNGAGKPEAEALIESVETPARVRQSAAYPLRVVVSSTVAQQAVLTLRRDGLPFRRETITLNPGKNAFAYSEKVNRPGLHRYDASLQPAADTISENNQAYSYVSVVGRPRVLYITETNVPSYMTLRDAMSAQGIDLQICTPGQAPAGVTALAAYDAILLSDVPAAEVGPQKMAAIELAVKNFGVGLGMIGGPNSFGAGHYGDTPIEAALPVRMDPPSKRRLPQAAVVVVLDASGSMAATEDGVEKVQLGARAAVQLMGSLQPKDQVAVTAVTETSEIVVPLQDAAKTAGARRAIESVYAGGGGIYCYQGLEDAYALLERSSAPIKHVILCADTSDSEQQEHCVEIAREMAKKNHVTTTVCGIGRVTDKDVPFQRELARAGEGQSLIVNEAADLPKLFQRDMQMVQQALFVEKPFLPRPVNGDMVLSDIPFVSEPPLLGYNVTTPKHGAAVALTVPGEDDALFSSWRYGLGRTFAFTSDDRAHWATPWLRWPEYSRFWAQALRWSFRSNAAADFQAAADNSQGRGHVSVDAFSQTGDFVNHAPLTATVVAPDLSTEKVTLTQTASGRYEGDFNTDQVGPYLVNVSHRENGAGGVSGTQTIGLVVPYSAEYHTLGANFPLLSRLSEETGGKIQPDPTQIFRDADLWVAGILDFAPWLLSATAVLFLLDIAVRRLGLRPKVFRDLVARGAELAGSRAAAYRTAREGFGPSAAPAQIEALLARPVSARAPKEKAPPRAENPLERRAVFVDDDDPFPNVASLPRTKPSDSVVSSPQQDIDYSRRLLDAKRQARQKDDFSN